MMRGLANEHSTEFVKLQPVVAILEMIARPDNDRRIGDDQVERFTEMCGATIPDELRARLEAVREDKRKVPIKEFLKWSVTFTAAASVICFIIGMIIWVVPFAN